jgi:hypothetical protein
MPPPRSLQGLQACIRSACCTPTRFYFNMRPKFADPTQPQSEADKDGDHPPALTGHKTISPAAGDVQPPIDATALTGRLSFLQSPYGHPNPAAPSDLDTTDSHASTREEVETGHWHDYHTDFEHKIERLRQVEHEIAVQSSACDEHKAALQSEVAARRFKFHDRTRALGDEARALSGEVDEMRRVVYRQLTKK